MARLKWASKNLDNTNTAKPNQNLKRKNPASIEVVENDNTIEDETKCPVCDKNIGISTINVHLDECLANADKKDESQVIKINDSSILDDNDDMFSDSGDELLSQAMDDFESSLNESSVSGQEKNDSKPKVKGVTEVTIDIEDSDNDA